MNWRYVFGLLVTLALAAPSCGVFARELPMCLDGVVTASQAVENRDPDALHRQFSEPLFSALPLTRLSVIFDTFAHQHGDVGTLSNPSWKHIQDAKGLSLDDVTVSIEFGDGFKEDLHFACDGRSIVGFHIRPPDPKSLNEAQDSKLVTASLTIPQKPYEITAIMERPAERRSRGLFIIVPGSGPADADGTVGNVHPYASLSHGLVNLGFTTIRFNKRPYAHPDFFVAHPEATIREELDDDVVALVKFTRADPKLKEMKVYLLGHSLGSESALRVASQRDDINGVVVLCGRSVDLPQMFEDQLRNFGQDLSVDERREFQTSIDNLRHLETHNQIVGPLPLGMSPEYAQDWISIRPTALALQLHEPVLVILGSADKNVDAPNIARWRTAFSGRNDKQFRLIDGMDHLLSVPSGRGEGSDQVSELVSQWAESEGR